MCNWLDHFAVLMKMQTYERQMCRKQLNYKATRLVGKKLSDEEMKKKYTKSD